MEHVATRRLIEASAGLDPGNRALLNLWLHRGLTDEAIARLAGLELGVIAARRLDIVRHLSDELGARPFDVLLALAAVIHPPREPEEVGRAPGDRQRKALALLAALAAAIVAGVVVILVISDGRSHGASGRAVRSGTTGSAARTSDGAVEPLEPLSVRAPHATGRVTVSGGASAKHLNLTVSGLPPVTGSHYEVWLYQTIIDAHAVGRIDTGVTRLSLALPADAARYPSIDISVQPPGYLYDSGESVLRAKNPLG